MPMSSFYNNTEDVVLEALEGLVASVPHLNRLDGFPEVKVVVDGDADPTKVAVISGTVEAVGSCSQRQMVQ